LNFNAAAADATYFSIQFTCTAGGSNFTTAIAPALSKFSPRIKISPSAPHKKRNFDKKLPNTRISIQKITFYKERPAVVSNLA
jgi:hypothetical protein